MINEWMQEMDRHIDHQPHNRLQTIKFHGQKRETDVKKLREADIVLTTYHTLASGTDTHRDPRNPRNPLNQIEWYRLVLDEGEQSTPQHQYETDF
jgi:SWI/SNF-related matrix-associated actin-dependent regulator of chromatin subfamily A3